MTLSALSYLAGALTILAPCILPVVPFVFARVDQPFVRSGLPLLVDAQGRIRFHHFGEGEYEKSEQVIRQLLDEARSGPHKGA